MRRIAQLAAGIVLLGGCGGEEIATKSIAKVQPQTAANRESDEGEDGLSASVRRDLATLRRVTAPFHRFDKAVDAGWSTKITDCMTDPGGAGGLGFHSAN